MLDVAALGLDRLLTEQAAFERNQATPDAYGAKAAPDWQPLTTVECFHWWGTGAAITRIGGIRESPERTVDTDIGGMIVPAGTDVSAHDRIGQIIGADGQVAEQAPLEILAVVPYEGFVELSFRKVA